MQVRPEFGIPHQRIPDAPPASTRAGGVSYCLGAYVMVKRNVLLMLDTPDGAEALRVRNAV